LKYYLDEMPGRVVQEWWDDIHEDETFALTKMWGDPTWINAMQALKSAFPEFNIEFDPVD